jgi:hypothetical protein
MRALKLPGLLAAGGVLLALSACSTPQGGLPPELSKQALCNDHYSTDPVGRDICMKRSDQAGSSVPDVRAQDLPIRTTEPSG